MRSIKALAFAAAILASVLSCAAQESKPAAVIARPDMFNVSIDAGLADMAGGYFSWCDYNNDTYPDLLIDGSTLLKNSGPPLFKFTDVTKDAGLVGAGGPGVWADYDNDGWMDFATNAAQLWKNESGRFRNVSAESGMDKMIPGVSSIGWGDFDQDGFVDLYVGASEGAEFKHSAHQLLRNLGNGKFEDVSARYGVDKESRYGRSIIWCDYDNDGQIDLYVGNYRLQPNYLWHINKDGSWTDVGVASTTAGELNPGQYTDPYVAGQDPARAKFGPQYGHTIGAAWADFNNDGLFDIWVSNLVHKYVGLTGSSDMPYDIRGYVCDDSKIYINQGGPEFKFADIRDKCGIPRRPIGGQDAYRGDELWSNAVCADFDNDTFVDAFVTQIYNLPYAVTLLYRNKGDLTFENVAGYMNIRYIDTYGAAWADYNMDGCMDLVVAGREKVDGPNGTHLFRNAGNETDWMEFVLEGSKSNRAAIGAKVEVRTSAGRYVRQVEGGTGAHSQQNMLTLHFGLGLNAKVEEVTVYWPSGLVQKLGAQKKNTLIKVKEPK